ncbi:MAG: ABC-2 transporter permease [Lachnospiraceae bacterium]|nr:ABC-2 transporter permease [Lachnospiraceae bacterium]
MKGLLVKDLSILGQQKKLGVLYLFLAVFLGYSMESSFLVSYFPMIATLLAFTTISYDSFDNGMAFLMTMPGARKNYAGEKYLLSLIVVTASWVFSVVLQIASLMIKKESFVPAELLGQDLLYIPMFLVVCSLMIPVVLKFGSEKGRIILFAIFGGVALILIFGKKIAEFMNVQLGWDVAAVIAGLEQVPAVTVAGVCGAVAVVLLLVSLLISNGIMKKKEY